MNKTAIIGIIIVVIILIGGILIASNRSNSQKMASEKTAIAKPTDEMSKIPSANEGMKPTGTMMDKNDLTMMGKSSSLGDYLKGPNGMALYTFDKDTTGKSNCNGICAVEWPPYVVNGQAPASMPAQMGTVTRDDGKMQYTWDGKPLYYYKGDKDAGDTYGNGYSNVWHIAK